MLSGGTSLLIFLLKLLLLLKRFITAFFVRPIYKIGRIILRFVFYKFVVKGYQFYLSAVKKLGWEDFRDSPFLFLLRQKMVHITVVVLTLLIVFSNLTAKAQTEGSTNVANKTILAGLIQSEFDNTDVPITEEGAAGDLTGVQTYSGNNTEPNSLSGTNNENTGLMVNQNGTALLKPDIFSTSTENIQSRTGIVYYTVQPGDVIGKIAHDFGLKINTILWENNLTANSLIRPGDKLAILPMDGISYTVGSGDSLNKIASTYNVNADSIAEANNLNSNQGLQVGQKLFIPGGRKIVSLANNDNSGGNNGNSGGSSDNSGNSGNNNDNGQSYSGLQILKNLISSKKPAAHSVSAGGKLAWPTVGYTITQYYSWRHQAIDIANHIGTPIYAADDGTIIKAGWSTGYGNNIVIDHGNGMETRYAHLSKFDVSVGDQVVKGQQIGEMGSTGWSTGPHVHFEVIINGVKYNPLNYLR